MTLISCSDIGCRKTFKYTIEIWRVESVQVYHLILQIAKKLQQTAKHVTKFSCRTQNLKIHLKENLVCKNCWDHSFQPGLQQQFITINHSKENCILGCITVNSKYQQ